MKAGLFLILIAGGILLLTAGFAFLWSIVWERRDKERLLLQQPDFAAKGGFSLTALPQEDFLRLDRVYLLGRRIGQLEFFVEPGWTAVLRLAPEEEDLRLWELDMPDFDQLTIRRVDGVRTELRQAQSGAALASWHRDGFSYALWLPKTEMGLAGSLLDHFARDCRCKMAR